MPSSSQPNCKHWLTVNKMKKAQSTRELIRRCLTVDPANSLVHLLNLYNVQRKWWKSHREAELIQLLWDGTVNMWTKLKWLFVVLFWEQHKNVIWICIFLRLPCSFHGGAWCVLNYDLIDHLQVCGWEFVDAIEWIKLWSHDAAM